MSETKGKYTVNVESAVGFQSYECFKEEEWLDMQSTTYLVLHLMDGRKLYLNDFNVRCVLSEKNL